MPLDFPSSPTVGQQFTFGVQTWQWNGTTWNIVATLLNSVSTFRNLIDNGAMNVQQRLTSYPNVTAVSKILERWSFTINALGTWTLSLETDGPALTGLVKSHKYLCSTADASPAAGDFCVVEHPIEGQFLQHLLWGTTSALAVTVSFWVKSNKTGTYVLGLYRGNANRLISAIYTINTVNTWEYKTITFPGDVTTGIANTAGVEMHINMWLASGSTFNGGALQTTWGSVVSNTRAASGVNLADTANNYWQITGVQLETGSVATSFEHRSYDHEFRRCQRYFQRWNDPPLRGVCGSTQAGSRMGMPFPTAMRSSPTAIMSASGTLSLFDGTSTALVSSITASYCTPLHAEVDTICTTAPLVLGRGCVMYKVGSGYIDFSAEM